MTEEKFKKAIAIKENLKMATDALNLLTEDRRYRD